MQMMAPTTKAPITVGLILLPMMYRSPCWPQGPGLALRRRRCVRCSTLEEGPNLRLRRGIPQGFRIAYRQHGLGFRIEEDAIVANRKNTRQLVRHHDHCGAEAISQL